MPDDLNGELAVTTGGSGGIGLVTVEGLGGSVHDVHAKAADDAQVRVLVAATASRCAKLDVWFTDAEAQVTRW